MASILQFSDGAAGVVTKKAFEEAITTWQSARHAPGWIPALNPYEVDWSDLSLADVYIEIGRYYPTVMLSQFNTNFDAVQMLFYYVMGEEDPTDWSVKALDIMKRTSNNIDNFKYFFGLGEFHTIIPEEKFYTYSANDVKLVDWLQTLLDQTNMGNIVCAECDLTETPMPELAVAGSPR